MVREKKRPKRVDLPVGERIRGEGKSGYFVRHVRGSLSILNTTTRKVRTVEIPETMWHGGIVGDFYVAHRDEHYVAVRLADGRRWQRTVDHCQYRYEIEGPTSVMVACLADDRITLHPLTGGAVIEPPFMPETWRFEEPFWVGDELYLIGQDRRYTWSPGQDSWTERGPGIRLSEPTPELAELLDEIHRKDPEFEGFHDGYYYSPSNWRYDVEARLFETIRRLGHMDFDPGIVRYGRFLLHTQSGRFRPTMTGHSANWAGLSALVLPENCPEGKTCQELPDPFEAWVLVTFDPAELPASESLGFE